jgi:hypothetical protein
MRTKTLSGVILAFMFLLVISCGGGGGGGDSSASTTTAATSTTVSGVASNGAAMTGTVYLKDSKGVEKNTIIGSGGSFSLSVDDLTAPFCLRLFQQIMQPPVTPSLLQAEPST